MSKARGRSLKALVEDVKGVAQTSSEAALDATKVTEAHWQENFTVLKRFMLQNDARYRQV